MTTAHQTIGDVEVLAQKGEGFDYPEFAQVTALLSDGTTSQNFVLQSSAPTVRSADATWQVVESADVETLRGYYETKDEVAYVEEDGTSRVVILMDFDAKLLWSGLYTVSATLLETTEPVAGS